MIYFDYAALAGPRPEAVYEAVNSNLRHLWGSPGRGSHSLALKAERLLFDCRRELSSFIHTDEKRIAFTKNTTEALNLAIKGVLKRGDHVVTT